MKRITLIALFLCSYLFAYSQTSAPIRPAAKLNVSVATGSNPYTLTVSILDDLSRFTFADFGVGDSVYLVDGSDLLIYVVTSKLTSPNRLVVNDVNNTGISAPTGQGAIIKSTANYKLPVYISGLRDDLRSMIMNRFSQLLDGTIYTASNEIYRYVGTTGVAPAVTAAVAGAVTAQNTVGEIYTWNPATNLTTGAWSIVSGGGATDSLESARHLMTWTQSDKRNIRSTEKGLTTVNYADTLQSIGFSLPTLNPRSGSVQGTDIMLLDDGVSAKKVTVDSLKATVTANLAMDTFKTAIISKRETDYVVKFENTHKHQFYKWNNTTQILETLSLVNDTTAIYRKWLPTWTPYQVNRDSFLTLLNISKVKISQVTDRGSVPTITSTIYDYKVGGYIDLAIAARKAGAAYGGAFFPHHGTVTASALTVNVYVDGVLQTGTTSSYTYCSKIELEQKTKMIIPPTTTGAGIDTLFDVYNLTTILPSKFNTKNRLKAFQNVQVGYTYVGMLEGGSGTHIVDGYGNVYSRTQGSDFSLPKNDQYTSFLMPDTNATKRDFIYGVTVKNPYETLRQSKVGFRRTPSGQGERVWYIATTGKLYGAVTPNVGTYQNWSKDTIWNMETEYITAISDNQYAFPNAISNIAQLPNSNVNSESWGVVNNTAWNKTGNAGTTAGTNFLGTTDGIGLVLKTNNVERIKVQNNGNVNIGGGNLNTLFTIRNWEGTPYTVPLIRITNQDSTHNLYLSNNSQSYGWGSTSTHTTGAHIFFRPTNDILFYANGTIPVSISSGGINLAYTTAGLFNSNSPNTKFWFPTSINHAAISTNSGGELVTVKETFVGIGNTNPQYKLDVGVGSVRFQGLPTGTVADSMIVKSAGVLRAIAINEFGIANNANSNKTGLRINQLTTTERDNWRAGGSLAGDLVYNSTLGKFQISDPSAVWQTVSSYVGEDSTDIDATITAGDNLSGGGTPPTITVTNAAVGDYVDVMVVSDDNDLTDINVKAWVSATDTVSYQIENKRATSIVFTKKTLKVRVKK